jgi:hypothetical protein
MVVLNEEIPEEVLIIIRDLKQRFDLSEYLVTKSMALALSGNFADDLKMDCTPRHTLSIFRDKAHFYSKWYIVSQVKRVRKLVKAYSLECYKSVISYKGIFCKYMKERDFSSSYKVFKSYQDSENTGFYTQFADFLDVSGIAYWVYSRDDVHSLNDAQALDEFFTWFYKEWVILAEQIRLLDKLDWDKLSVDSWKYPELEGFCESLHDISNAYRVFTPKISSLVAKSFYFISFSIYKFINKIGFYLDYFLIFLPGCFLKERLCKLLYKKYKNDKVINSFTER